MSSEYRSKYLRQLPSVGKLLEHPKLASILDTCPRVLLVKVIRDVLDSYKAQILSASDEEQIRTMDLSLERIMERVSDSVRESARMGLRRAINATGDVLDERLGRAPLNESAQKALADVARGYSTAGVDIETGEHADRDTHIQTILSLLTGAETGLVLNNNASAIMLILNTISDGKEVIVSRGQLIENDDFRLPDIIAKSGAKLVSVGTTNKTHLKDYRNAINEATGIILKVHKSNYRILGFTEDVPIQELSKLGRAYGIPVVFNIGSGLIIDLTQQGFLEEPSASLSIKSGADIVCFSGDKLLGGPQAGIVIGSKKFILMMKENPLYRALRAGKLTISALEATLRSYLDTDRIMEVNPVLRLLSRPIEEIEPIARSLADSLSGKLSSSVLVRIEDGYSQMETVSFPAEKFPTKLVSISPAEMSASELGRRLRSRPMPIFVIVREDRILIDPRTIWEDEIGEIEEALRECLHHPAESFSREKSLRETDRK